MIKIIKKIKEWIKELREKKRMRKIEKLNERAAKHIERYYNYGFEEDKERALEMMLKATRESINLSKKN